MARKVFMSVLGTSDYKICAYVRNLTKYKSRFVQDAILRDLGADKWGVDDVVYIFLTEEARKSNWSGGVRKDGRKVQYDGLAKVLSDANLQCAVHGVDIVDGKDETEMWQVFNTIYDLLQDGDELYFDVTHGYRYLPMFLLVLGNYSKFLKNTRVEYVSYGNYEARYGDGEIQNVPIMDLLPIVRLQDWTFAAGQFLRSGDADEICNLGSGQCIEIKRRIKCSDANVDGLNSYVKALKTMADDMAFCRGMNVIKGLAIQSMRIAQDVIKEETIPAFTPLIGKITDSFCSFVGSNSVQDTYSAAKWCLDKGLYQQAVTFLRESMVSYLCEKYGIDLTNKELRALVDSVFVEKNPDKKENKTVFVQTENLELYKRISSDCVFGDKQFVSDFCHLQETRNDMNHSGMNDNYRSVKTLKANIDSAVKQMEHIFVVDDTRDVSLTPPLFINYSNHPSSGWSPKQLSAAREFGETVDIPFRSVAPEADSAELERIASEELAKILDAAAGKNAVVHLMGEMTLTYILVRKLKASGIRCVASTTARCVTENPDGTRTSDFDFVRFRDYE